MMEPRDLHIVDRVGLVGAARLFSNVVSPPVMFACLGLALAWHELPFWPGLAWAAFYGFFVALAPILFVFYLLKRGHILELHMSNTQERHLPYFIAVLGASVVFTLILLLDGPDSLRCLSLFNIFILAALGAINVRWLISFHASGVMATSLISGLVFGRVAGFSLLPLVVLVVAVRLYLKRHTWAQVVGGMTLAVVTVYVLTRFGCFT